MAMTVVTGPGEVFLEAPSKPESSTIIETPQLPPIIEDEFKHPSIYYPMSNPLPIFPPPMIRQMSYMQPQYDYHSSPSFLRTSNISQNTSSKKVKLLSNSTTGMPLFKQLLFVFFGMILTGVPLAVVTTFYLQQRIACTTTTSTSTTTITTTTSMTTTASWILPSQCFTYTTMNDSTRSVSAGAGTVCDNTLISGWYRFLGNSTMLATSYVTKNTCTTQATGSYNGIIPSIPGTTAYGTLCLNYNGYLCYAAWSGITIGVTNCDSYYVFYLTRISNCNSRYCTIP